MTSDSRYSAPARRALLEASQLARQHHHAHVDTSHLLVGILRAEGSLGGQIMHRMNLSEGHAEAQLQRLYPANAGNPEEPAISETLQTALQLAANESAWLAQHYIGSEHLLLGITRTNAGEIHTLLRRLGTTPEQLQQQVRRALNAGASELDLQLVKHLARPSELARRVLNAAEQIALMLDQPEVTLGHLLLGLAQETRSPTAALLRDSGLDETLLRMGLMGSDPRLMVPIGGVLTGVLDLIDVAGSHYAGTEHLLLALMTDPAGREALLAFGVRLGALQPHLNLK